MIRARAHPLQILLLSMLAAFTSPPLEASGQQWPAIAGRDDWSTDFSKHTVPLEEFTSGGPPKDGIRSIDRPSFVTVREADDWLKDREPVAVVRVNGVTKAYPLSILIWHEIVNDEIGGEPVTVTYCPLCNTTIAFDRNFDGQVLEFGTTGRLRHSDLVMYDRQSETWWQQATGEGLVGAVRGRPADPHPRHGHELAEREGAVGGCPGSFQGHGLPGRLEEAVREQSVSGV